MIHTIIPPHVNHGEDFSSANSHNDRVTHTNTHIHNDSGIAPGIKLVNNSTNDSGNTNNLIIYSLMKKKEFIEAVEAATNVAKIKKLVMDNEIEVNLDGMNKDDAKAAVLAELEENYAEFEDDDELVVSDEDQDDAQDNEDLEDENPISSGSMRNRNKKVETLAQKIARIKADPNRDCDDIVRTVAFLNNLVEKDGEFGSFELGTMTLVEPIDGYVAQTNELGITEYVPGDQFKVFFIKDTLIDVIRHDPMMAGIYNQIRDDKNALYQVVANTQFKFLVEYISANQQWFNPFSKSAHPRSRGYDHDWVAVMPYAVKELGPDAEFKSRVASVGDNPALLMKLIEVKEAKLRKIKR